MTSTATTIASYPNTSSFPLLADMQYREYLGSSALNRKTYGIIPAGIFKGFYVTAGTGLTVVVSSSTESDAVGIASVEVDGQYQVTLRQQADLTLTIAAGTAKIVVLQGFYQTKEQTSQVNTDSSTDAVSIVLLDVGTDLAPNQLELATVTVPSGTTQIKSDMIDLSGRILRSYSIERSSAVDSDSEVTVATSSAVKKALASAADAAQTLINETPKKLLFTTTGYFTAPNDVYYVYATGCGAGGGGGGGGGSISGTCGAGGGGGGAGQSCFKTKIAVTPGKSYLVTIGSGGAPGNGGKYNANGTNGVSGGNTSFASLLTLNGGSAGGYGVSATASGVNVSGGAGAQCGQDGSSEVAYPFGIGGVGEAGPFGSPGGSGRAGKGGSVDTTSARGYGVGGSGGCGSYGSGSFSGSPGAYGRSGMMIIEW